MEKAEFYKPSGKFSVINIFCILIPNILLSILMGATLYFPYRIDEYYFFIVPLCLTVILYFILKKLILLSKCRNPFVAGVLGLIVGFVFYSSFIFLIYFNFIDFPLENIPNKFINFLVNFFYLNKEVSIENILEGYFSRALAMLFEFIFIEALLGYGAFDIAKNPFDENKNCWLLETKIFFPEGYSEEFYTAIHTGNWNIIDLLDSIPIPNEAYGSFVKIQLFGNLKLSDQAYIRISEKKRSSFSIKSDKTQKISIDTYKKLIEKIKHRFSRRQ